MQKYRIFQMVDRFCIDIEAKSKEEALEKAKKITDWNECDEVADAISYEVIKIN